MTNQLTKADTDRAIRVEAEKEVKAERARCYELVRRVVRFSNYQEHVHSWHDLQFLLDEIACGERREIHRMADDLCKDGRAGRLPPPIVPSNSDAKHAAAWMNPTPPELLELFALHRVEIEAEVRADCAKKLIEIGSLPSFDDWDFAKYAADILKGGAK